MGLTFEEALVGATINAAYSLDRHDAVGSLEPGKQMDAVIVDGPAIDLIRVGRRHDPRGDQEGTRRLSTALDACVTDKPLRRLSSPRSLRPIRRRAADRRRRSRRRSALAADDGGRPAEDAQPVADDDRTALARRRRRARRHPAPAHRRDRRRQRRLRSRRRRLQAAEGNRPTNRRARKPAIERALREATDVPLGVMRLSVDALKHAQAVAAHGHRAAASDVGVAVALLRAGLRGAR